MYNKLIITGALLLSLIFTTNSTKAQDYIPKEDVPILVVNNFYDHYFDAHDVSADVKWMKDYGNTYTAEFVDGKGNEQRISYDEYGSIVRTETEIEANALPFIIREHFISTYPDYDIDYSGMIDSEDGILYRVGYINKYPVSKRVYIYYNGDGTSIDIK